MFAVEVDYKNYVTGEARTTHVKGTYKTLRGAEKAARQRDGIVRLFGKEKTEETWGRVVPAQS